MEEDRIKRFVLSNLILKLKIACRYLVANASSLHIEINVAVNVVNDDGFYIWKNKKNNKFSNCFMGAENWETPVKCVDVDTNLITTQNE